MKMLEWLVLQTKDVFLPRKVRDTPTLILTEFLYIKEKKTDKHRNFMEGIHSQFMFNENADTNIIIY